ncbi:LysR family transcriptional regulator [Castellaniella defragrans]|uniref:LysR family transcriptional activator of nhaA n=1 Tax=Castellaniella defragrans TaxID=75697 RepID=A0A7W9TNP0_CASDE|nr:LysR family transcriptional regulator [Castellaniella defragrans]KAB0599922.1 LysR family transcriptional regulator [Castellaniella defragrans]MBB6083491.1 LysR family transcriptional activator of nhaA [Castellaniella defragrans]
MDINQLNFKHLFYFWRVAKQGSLTHAAEQIHTSQSALSTQIRQLENRLGTPLFDRQGRHLELTATGQQVFAYAESIFALGEQMLGWLEGRDEGATRVRVGSVSTMSRNFQVNWLRPLLHDPTIVLSVDSGSLETLVERLLRHQLDVVLANEPVPSDPTRPTSSRFLGSQVISLVGRADRWSGTALRVPEDLDGVEMAMPSVRHGVRLQFDALCFSAGVQPRLRAEIDDMTMLRLIARDSGWITVLPEVVVQDELHSGELVHVGQSSQLTEHFYAITVRHGHLAGPLSRLLSREAAGDIFTDASDPIQPTRNSSCSLDD